MLSDMAQKGPSLDSVDPSVLAHIVDVHCHPVETPYHDQTMVDLPIHICAMATTASDQQKVATLARKWPDKVTPAFGTYLYTIIGAHSYLYLHNKVLTNILFSTQVTIHGSLTP